MISISLAACGRTPGDRIFTAGDETGKTQAQFLLPDWPPSCRAHVPYAQGALTMDPVVLDKLDRAQIDAANRKLDSCAQHYDDLQKALATVGTR